MTIKFGTKITDGLFSYPLIGMNRHVIYNREKRDILLTDNDGHVLRKIDENKNLDYDTFVMVAKCIFVERIDSSN